MTLQANDIVLHKATGDIKTVFISLGGTFVGTDGSLNYADDYELWQIEEADDDD